MFYAVPTSRVIFTAKTSLDLFTLGLKPVWTYPVLGDDIYEMKVPVSSSGTQCPLYSHFIRTLGRPMMFCGSCFMLSAMQTLKQGTLPFSV